MLDQWLVVPFFGCTGCYSIYLLVNNQVYEPWQMNIINNSRWLVLAWPINKNAGRFSDLRCSGLKTGFHATIAISIIRINLQPLPKLNQYRHLK